MKIAYLINQYPKVSHSFIRREIFGLESSGLEIVRFSIRSCGAELVDKADKMELEKTRVLLAEGARGLLSGLLYALLTNLAQLLDALYLTIKLGYRSERGLLRHFVYLLEACLLLKWVQEAGVQHIHSHFGTNSTTVAMLCHELGVLPIVLRFTAQKSLIR